MPLRASSIDNSKTLNPLYEVRLGGLSVRLAQTELEIEAAQSLRYRIFYKELGASESLLHAVTQRDADEFDQVADHLLVIDHSRTQDHPEIIGTYRLIKHNSASTIGRFYSEMEYDLSKIGTCAGAVLELGRSCVDVSYRHSGAMQLLWQAIASYVVDNSICLMFGCASFPGTNPDDIASELTYLHQHHLAPAELRPIALRNRFIEMRRLDSETINARQVASRLPPLIKGYLRLGGFVGDGAVIDVGFNTIDVAMVVRTDLVAQKYYRHYLRPNTN